MGSTDLSNSRQDSSNPRCFPNTAVPDESLVCRNTRANARSKTFSDPASHSARQDHTPIRPGTACRHPSSSLSRSVNRATEWLQLLNLAAVDAFHRFPAPGGPMLLTPLLDPRYSSSSGDHKRQRLVMSPGILYFNQGTEEASRPKAAIPSSHAAASRGPQAHSPSIKSTAQSSNAPIPNTPFGAPTKQARQLSDTQGSSLPNATPSSLAPSPAHSTHSRSTAAASSTIASARDSDKGNSEGSNASHPSSSAGRSEPAATRGPSASVGAGSTTALLYTTSQEFGQIWTQTTAFLHRTFSPTYRVGSLYLDSWTNGTQKRGLERLKASLLRGDTFLLMRNTTLQLRDLLKKSIAVNKAQAADIERHAKTIEEARRFRHGQGELETGKESSTSTPSEEEECSGRTGGDGGGPSSS
ncbi:unnamed protein product [Mortierella alpina]